MKVTHTPLSSGWRFREVERVGVAAHNNLPWQPAQVPGFVHLDLMRAGVITDPFQRMSERAASWVDEQDWVYETTFTVADPPPAHTFLLFQGLDTIAEIVLNGQTLAQTDNMFIAHEFPVDGLLHGGENVLQVTFRSALRVGRERQRAWDESGNDTLPYHWDNWNERAFVRKAQYMYGWDWGPVLVSCGLWRPVELVTVPQARLGDWKYVAELPNDGPAILHVTTEVERMPGHEDDPLTLTFALPSVENAYLDVAGDVLPESVSVPVPIGPGLQTVTHAFTLEAPRLWWPLGHLPAEDAARLISSPPEGIAPISRYGLRLSLAGEEELDRTEAKIGLRTIELLHEPDADGGGEGFKFRVNGHDIFAKGANWIPNDSFVTRILQDSPAVPVKNDSVRQRIEDACRASFNMLRVWGGGFYESEHFYDLCDAHGLLVWQDFAYGCSYYPDTGAYAENSRAEARAAVRRLRNHPSLALWCGNNENQTMFDGNWTKHRPTRLLGDHLYHEILPAVLAEEDPQTPYWPSSPYGGPSGDSNSADYGDCHNWDVWHGRGDWVNYAENNSRFCSEFGFASSCGLEAWDSVLAPADKHPQSPVVRWHDKTRKGYETYLGYIGLHFPDPQSLEDLVYYSQLNQAEALKFGIEHYRRLKGRCWGTLFWQLNDCWPVQSWAIIDSLGEPKAAYFFARQFYAPVLLSLKRDGQSVQVHLTSDLLQAVEGTLTLTLETVEGEVLAQEQQPVRTGPNGTETVAAFPLENALGREQEAYLHARFQPGENGTSVSNLLLLGEPKDLRLPSPQLTVDVEDSGELFLVTVQAARFAPYVWLHRLDNRRLTVDANFFHLRAGEARTVAVAREHAAQTAADLQSALIVRTL